MGFLSCYLSCPLPYFLYHNHKYNVLSASLNKIFPSFLPSFLSHTHKHKYILNTYISSFFPQLVYCRCSRVKWTWWGGGGGGGGRDWQLFQVDMMSWSSWKFPSLLIRFIRTFDCKYKTSKVDFSPCLFIKFIPVLSRWETGYKAPLLMEQISSKTSQTLPTIPHLLAND